VAVFLAFKDTSNPNRSDAREYLAPLVPSSWILRTKLQSWQQIVENHE
jgi:hypothetical protein